jgi:eukaryotic-like serine/threonine-protein kinase
VASPAPRGSAPTPARRLVLAGLLVVLLAAAGLAFWGLRDPGGEAAGQPGASPDQAAPVRAAPDQVVLGAGYVACGDGFCPVAPMCWRGLTRIGDQVMAPGRADCTEDHFWETFAVGYLPVDAAGLTPDKLISHPGVAALCSASVLASRRADGARTKGWKRTAWPMVLDGTGTWLVHCLAGPKSGETTKSVFRAG